MKLSELAMLWLVGNISAKKYQLHYPPITIGTFKLTNSEDGSAINPENIQWVLPADWNVSISSNKSEVSLNSVSTMESKEIKAKIHNGNTFDTLRHIVHVVNYTDSNNTPPMRKAMPCSAESTNAHQIVVYPNPSNGLINIYLGADKQQAQLDIYNLMGTKVRSEQINSSFTTFDISSLSNGNYIFRISNEQTQEAHIIHINH